MGFIDRLAAHAFTTGRSTQEFRKAAQGNANATWGWLILAAVVWYFTGLGWAAIPLVFAAYSAYRSVSATMVANKLDLIYQKSVSG